MKIKVNKSNGRVYLPDKYLARDMDNLIQTFEVEFDDEFIEGIGQLDFILPSGTKGYINMELNDETYSVPIYNSICKEGRLDLQFLVFLNARFILTSDTKIIEGHTYYVKQGDTYVEVENPVEEDLGEYYVESVPLYHSKMFNLTVDPSINAELEQDEEYPTKIALINAKLKEVEDAIDDCEAATEGAENVNISQSKSNHTISITTTDRNDTQTTETLTEPTASVSKVDKTATITITDANGTTSASVKDGANFEYNWDGTSLGVKTDEESEYSYVDLEGPRGPQGPQGEAFQIKKTYPTIQAMVDDYYNMSVNDYVMIDGDVETQDNATLWVKEETPAVGTLWHYLADFSGASGIQGPQGEQGPRGEQGIQGIQGPIGLTGNGISTITKTSTSGLVDTYTILYTNGDTTTYDITNGANGNITDVQLDGTSIVTNHVANALTTGYSTDNKLITEKDYNRAMSIYNVLPKVNGTGENISLDNTGVAPLNMDLYGNTYQETTSISGGDEYDSPSPDHPQPIQVVSGDNEVKVVGENLLDGTLIDRGHSYTYGNVGQTPYIQVNNSRATLSPTNAIKVKPNTSYIINHNSTWRLAVAQLKEDGVSLGDSGWKTSSNMPFTITTNANCKYIAFNFSKVMIVLYQKVI